MPYDNLADENTIVSDTPIDKINGIKYVLKEIKLKFVEISNNSSIDIVYDLLVNGLEHDNKMLKAIDDSVVYFYYGYCYQYIKKDYAKMKNYYIDAIIKCNNDAMIELQEYYREIEQNNGLALFYIALYHEKLSNYPKMKQYYSMAISKGNILAMFNLGLYYHQIEKNYVEMKKHYLMAIEKGSVMAMFNLGYYYQYTEPDRGLMRKYYSMAMENNDKKAIRSILADYYNNAGQKYCIDEANDIVPYPFIVGEQ